MNDERYFQIISGQRRGVMATGTRAILRVLSGGYSAIIAARNLSYEVWKLPKWLDVPVFSIGNITVGGTGKSPMAVWMCQRLLERHRKPAVLSRGYKADAQGLADELLMISRQCPKAVVIAHPNRWAAGQLAITDYAAQAIILDDGFQHRRVARDLDMVLIDASRPFGYGYLLPRGLLREPPESLHRADAIVITRSDQSEPAFVDALERQLHQLNDEAIVVRAVHRPTGFADLTGESIEPPRQERLGWMAGIARPEAFERTLRDRHLPMAAGLTFADHHVYTLSDAERIGQWAREHRLQAIVTTEKDAVKLRQLAFDWPVPIAVLRVEIEMLGDGDTMLGNLIDETLHNFEETHEQPSA